MSFYNHFREDERPFVDRVMEWAEQTRERYQKRTTDFLDPRQAFIVQSVVGGQPDIFVKFYGGYEGAERCRAVIYPEYLEPETGDYSLALLEINNTNSFVHLEHRDYLGAVLGIGLKRDKFGDLIVVDDNKCQLVVAKEIADYVTLHLHQVNRVQVTTEIIDIKDIQPPFQKIDKKTITASSLRVDAITSEVCNLSRSKVLSPIKNGRLKVNWKLVESPSLFLQPGDIVSLKGFGRFKVCDIQGKSKKGRYIIDIGKYM